MSNKENILIVAFDGLDKEWIEEFGLEHINQKEFGEVNNYESTYSIKTSELFATFITGENFEEHGIKGLEYDPNPLKTSFLDLVIPKKVEMYVSGFGRMKEALRAIIGHEESYRPSKSELDSKTIFDEIENSRAMFIPSYNPSMFWESESDLAPLQYGRDFDEIIEHWDRLEFAQRKRRFLSELENDIVSPRDLLMVHFHRTDIHQHGYGDPYLENEDKHRLRKLYKETDEFAKEIKEKALQQGYDTVIFMSDHGRPAADSNTGHNKNAFYSCNKPLFGNKTPQLADFYNKIIF